jgi:cardiolipin synthase
MKKNINLPNIISAIRLFIIFPVLLFLAFANRPEAFAWLMLFSLITDLADGFIARRFNMVTEFGSRLDSIADIGNYIAALTGILVMYWGDVSRHSMGFSVLFGLYFIELFVMLYKFRKHIGLHLYIVKFTGYMHGFFLLTWLFFGFNETLYIVSMILGYYSFTEEIVLLIMLKKPDHDLKSLYWVLLQRKDLYKD